MLLSFFSRLELFIFVFFDLVVGIFVTFIFIFVIDERRLRLVVRRICRLVDVDVKCIFGFIFTVAKYYLNG